MPIRAKAIPYPKSRSSFASGSVISRSSVPVVRSRSIVIEVTTNIVLKGKSPTKRPSHLLEGRQVLVEGAPQQGEQEGRDAEHQDDRSAGRGGAAVSTRTATAHVTRALTPVTRSSIRARNASSSCCAPGAPTQAVGAVDGEQAPVAHQQQLVAVLGLLHHVAGDEQGRAGGGQRGEGRPEVAAQHRVEADGRLVQHQHLRLAEQRGGERDPRAAGHRRGCETTLIGVLARARPSRSPPDPRVPGTPRTRPKKRRFSRTVRSP